ncbi:MAG: hypothetical protein E4H24_00275 [Thermomicrobiales bacterium]|nr:MAG: hypothetical protein E4H24_00275 [Thermomicrobiales bacterium]
MTEAPVQPLRLSYQVIIAIAIGCIAPFTGFAWPFALLTGLVLGRDDQDRRTGTRVSVPARLLRLLAVTGGVLAMLFAGAILGGLIAFGIVWLVVISERLTVDVAPTDRVMARLILSIGAVVGFFVLGAFVDVNFSLGLGQ